MTHSMDIERAVVRGHHLGAVMMMMGILVAVMLFVPSGPGTALAASPLPGGSVPVTGFHEAYDFAGGRRMHGGVDLAASEGAVVCAPVDGVVSFVGRIPSGDDGASATMLGVSLRLPDGRTLTMLPFATTLIAEGDAVSQGDDLGFLAGSGDRSISDVHLHVGLKRGKVYEDPSPLLGLGGYADGGDPDAPPTSQMPPAMSDAMPGDVRATTEGADTPIGAPTDEAPAVETVLGGSISSEVTSDTVPVPGIPRDDGSAAAPSSEPGLEVDTVCVVMSGVIACSLVVLPIPGMLRRRSVSREEVVSGEEDVCTEEGRGSAVAGRLLVLVGRG